MLVLLVPGLSGCLDWLPEGVREPIEDLWFDIAGGPGTVYATQLIEEGWNREGRLQARVVHDEPLSIAFAIERLDDGATVVQESPADAAQFDDTEAAWINELDFPIPDGTWDIALLVDGRVRQEWSSVRIDTAPPRITGLESSGRASDGSYTIGSGAAWNEGTLEVIGPSGALIANTLPHTVHGLGDGLHAYRIVVTDPAGNERARIVQILAGDAKELPEGQHDAGIVARYTNRVQVWDLTANYLSPAEAAAAEPDHLGAGFGVDPDDPDVQAAVDEVVEPGMDTMQAARALFRWLYDELEYDEQRLEEDDLLEPGDTFAQGGGVCRDLAAAYVSLLRAAGIPARLVTGYLAGGVNGFHAWVEFYGGAVGSQPGWIPVDVSPIDGLWNDDGNNDGTPDGRGTLWQSFGVRLPHYLPLRALPSAAEIDGWATAIAVEYSFPKGKEPEFEYAKDLRVEGDVEGVLCVNSETDARLAVASASECTSGYDLFFGGGSRPFILQSTQVIDYGLEVQDAASGTEFDIHLAVPFASEVAPVTVEHLWYSNHDATRGRGLDDGKRSLRLTY